MSTYLNNARSKKALSRYFDAFDIPLNKLSIYSYLQHYGSPSPLVDFTTNLKTALYFATEKLNIDSTSQGNCINDYFSIFCIAKSDLELINVTEVFNSMSPVKDFMHDALSNYEDYKKTMLDDHIDNLIDINTLEVYLVENNVDLEKMYNINNNIRVVAQDGLFIHNGYNDLPLEIALKTFLKSSTIYQPDLLSDYDLPGRDEVNEKYEKDFAKNVEFNNRLQKNIITSVEINKSLVYEIKKELETTIDDIYPDPATLCKQIFNESK